VGGARALWAVHVAPPSIQKYLFAMLLEALSYPLPYGVMHVGFGGLVSHRWTFFFSSSLENYNFNFYLVDISTSEFIHLFFYFCSWSFVEVLFVFNLIIQSQFIKYYIFQFGPYSFYFYFFSLTLFVKVLLVFNFIIQFKLMILSFSI
jgi:hypothetical protein